MKTKKHQSDVRKMIWAMGCAALLLTACQNNPPQAADAQEPTYVLVLTDTTKGVPTWLQAYRTNLPKATTLAVSGYPKEKTEELLSRLPWLLQPGVDTLIVDYPVEGRLCDSVASWSPATVCKIRQPAD